MRPCGDTLKIVLSVFLALLDLIVSQDSFAGDHHLNYNPQSYVLSKLKTRDIVFLGTRHKQPSILEFISGIITMLRNSGITHIGLEIATDQQRKMNRFVETGTGLSEIQWFNPGFHFPACNRHLLSGVHSKMARYREGPGA